MKPYSPTWAAADLHGGDQGELIQRGLNQMNEGDNILFVYQDEFGVFEIVEILDSIPADFGRTLLKLKRVKDSLVFNCYKTDDMKVVKALEPDRRL